MASFKNGKLVQETKRHPMGSRARDVNGVPLNEAAAKREAPAEVETPKAAKKEAK